jgi:uncharacterized protein YukE
MVSMVSTGYDNAVIMADPQGLADHAKNLHTHADDVAQSVKNIVDALFHLRLGWVGKTSDEAQEFNDRWSKVMKDLFGTEQDPSHGVLNAMAMGVQNASQAYDGAEDVLIKMFDQFSIGSSSSAGGGGPNAAASDSKQTAITETW